MKTSLPPRRRFPVAVRAGLVALAIVVAGLAACSSSRDASGTSAGAPAAPNFDQGKPAEVGDGGVAQADTNAEKAAAPEGGGSGQPGTNQQAPTQVEPQQRSLIYTGAMSVKVTDVSTAANAAIDVANGMGGSVGGDRRTLDADRSQAQLVLRVPSDKFDEALTALGKLGTEENRSVNTQDVTEQLIDLDSRLATQRASVERVRALLARAQTIGEVVSVESELTRREADLDSLEQRKTRLAGLVSLSTITLDLRGPAAPTPDGEDPDPGFLGGLQRGWSAFVDSIQVVLVVAGWLLPWVVAVGVPVFLVVWFLRRRRAAATTATAPPAPAPPTSEPATPS